MSFGGGYNGGRTRMSTKVLLNVYDLSPLNDYLFHCGVGLHHTGVEILGSEYSFASGAGIFEAPPRMAAPGATFREQVDMGAFEGTSADLKRVIADLQSDFRAQGDYNLVTKNCNHFANALCWRLLRKQIPAHINRLANLGACCTCLLPRQMLESAPVGDPNNAAGNGSGNGESKSFLVHAPPGRQQGGTNNSGGGAAVFSGAGARLGGSSMTSTPSTTPMDRGGGGLFSKWTSSSSTESSTSSTSANGSSGNDLTDRRERARKAALARLEQNNNNQQSQPQSPTPKQS